MGIDKVFADNQAQIVLHEFDNLLDGVAAEIIMVPDQIRSVVDTAQTNRLNQSARK